MDTQDLVVDKLREMLEAKTIRDLETAYWQLQGMFLAGAIGDPDKAKELYHMRLDELAPNDDLGPIHPTVANALKPFIGGLR